MRIYLAILFALCEYHQKDSNLSIYPMPWLSDDDLCAMFDEELDTVNTAIYISDASILPSEAARLLRPAAYNMAWEQWRTELCRCKKIHYDAYSDRYYLEEDRYDEGFNYQEVRLRTPQD